MTIQILVIFPLLKVKEKQHFIEKEKTTKNEIFLKFNGILHFQNTHFKKENMKLYFNTLSFNKLMK